MGLVLYALKYRVTFFVFGIIMLLGGVGSAIVTKKDVLPTVDIPVVVIVWTYTGLDTTDMASRITTYSEFSLTNNVNNIKRLESQTLQGTTIEKVYFDPQVSIDLAIAQVVSSVNSIRAVMPPGVQPPVVLRFSASSVPVIQLALSSPTQSGAALYDYAMYRIRQTLSTTPGATLPAPYGGAPRQIMVDLDLHALQAHGLTPTDVVTAVSSQNVVVPSGLAKFGAIQYPVRLNAAPEQLADLNNIPIKVVNGMPILVHDVAYVRDGSPPQQNFVLANGKNAVLMPIYKNGPASTLTVVNSVKSAMPIIRAAAPKGVDIKPLFDQSVFVSGAISDVIREAVTAASLTGLTIFIFLGSWRSTLVVLVSIPLSILTSLSILSLIGETINVMTLGGLALAIGILVDDATVAVENTYRLMEEGHSFRASVVEGAAGIAKPALISTLAICSAFVSVLFLTDTPKYLFTPQAFAVVFAMLTSYVLSRTIVPILIDILVEKEFDERFGPQGHHTGGRKGLIARFQDGFERRFAKFHRAYLGLIHATIRHRGATLATVGCVLVLGGVLFKYVGQDYFPQIDAGEMTLHIRTPSGMRLETTQQRFVAIEKVVRKTLNNKVDLVLDNVGLPSINYNFAFGDGSVVGYNDGEMLIQLSEGSRESTATYMRRLRSALRAAFPDTIFYFQPSDMITQILDFGTITSVDVQVTGRHQANDLQAARNIVARLKRVKGAVDVHLQQIVDAPEFFATIDRQMASEIGINTQQIASAMNVSLSGSFQVTPSFWSDPKTGIPYQLWVQTPEYRNDNFNEVKTTPIFVTAGATDTPGILTMLESIAEIRRQTEQTVVNHLNAQPVFDIFANVQYRDLGSVKADIDRIIAEEQKKLPAPDFIVIRGQIQQMQDAFLNIGLGLLISIVVVYLLMVVNYQSWGDPFVVLCALPLAFCGIMISLFVTQTTLSIPSLFGAIMSVGVASANSILLVTFAREHREANGCSAAEAAIAAGETRLRPVLMTAGAMFVGLIPMAIGIGEGSEQNAALARAVLGGVAVGTCSTLLFVPFLYSVLRRGKVTPVEDYV
jgi:multidrug efflux pump subunit AcrB